MQTSCGCMLQKGCQYLRIWWLYIDFSRRNAAHLFEVRHSIQFDNEALDKKLEDLQIDSIHASSNLISLCKLCHQQLNYIRIIRSPSAWTTSWLFRSEFATMHGKVIEFDGPPFAAQRLRCCSIDKTLFESVTSRKRPRQEIEVRQNVNPQWSSEGVAPATTTSSSAPATTGRTTRARGKGGGKVSRYSEWTRLFKSQGDVRQLFAHIGIPTCKDLQPHMYNIVLYISVFNH